MIDEEGGEPQWDYSVYPTQCTLIHHVVEEHSRAAEHARMAEAGFGL